MPVYIFTYHAYGSWLPDRSQGFVQQGGGIQAPNVALATAYKSAMKHPRVLFDRLSQTRLIKKLLEIAAEDAIRLHAVATDATHLHAVVSWRDPSLSWKQVRGRIKNLLSLALSRAAGTTGRPWFVKGASRKRVQNQQHLEYLLQTYLPKHSGVQWYEHCGWVGLPADETPGLRQGLA